MTAKKFLNLDHARTEEQIKLMEKIKGDGVCPFCKEYFKKYHPKPIIKETDYWFFTENMSPYKGTKFHFIIVYKPKHINKPHEIEPEAAKDLMTLVSWAAKKYKFKGGGFFMRFGDPRFNGSSVHHLHAQMLMGDFDEPNHEPVRVKLG